jgi:hypothetical protein
MPSIPKHPRGCDQSPYRHISTTAPAREIRYYHASTVGPGAPARQFPAPERFASVFAGASSQPPPSAL